MTPTRVRTATVGDAAACAALYAPYVRDSTVSFETEAPDPEEMSRRIRSALDRHTWVVAEQGDVVVGYAYATAYKPRPAYRWTCEVSVYVASERRGAGVGGALYEALLERLANRGYRTAVAAMTMPNPASTRLHEALGFRPCGVLTNVGWKAGRWHDVALFQRGIGAVPNGDGPPEEPS